MRRKRTKINVGDKFNKLTIVEFIGHQNNHRTFKAICECGNFTIVKGTHLVQENIKSCGCLFLERITKKEGHRAFTYLFTRNKRNAISRDLDFNLTFEQFISIINQNCFYCGIEPQKFNPYLNKNGHQKFNKKGQYLTQPTVDRAWIVANGLDRYDNNLGYLIDNVVPCCPQCNQSKMDFTVTDFLSHAEKITNYQKTKLVKNEL